LPRVRDSWTTAFILDYLSLLIRFGTAGLQILSNSS
jgi:hypothetical protein